MVDILNTFVAIILSVVALTPIFLLVVLTFFALLLDAPELASLIQTF